MRSPRPDILKALQSAEVIQFNGEFAEPDYLRVPDEDIRPDDVVLEINVDDSEEDFTLAELEAAQLMGEGIYFIEKRGYLRFLARPTVH